MAAFTRTLGRFCTPTALQCLVVLSLFTIQTPGPGTYTVVDSQVFSHKSPAYSLHERCPLPGDNSMKPGPGAHSPEKVSSLHCYIHVQNYAHAQLLGKYCRQLLAVETFYLHRTQKWITTSCSKNQEVRTNNKIVMSDCTLKDENHSNRYYSATKITLCVFVLQT